MNVDIALVQEKLQLFSFSSYATIITSLDSKLVLTCIVTLYDLKALWLSY